MEYSRGLPVKKRAGVEGVEGAEPIAPEPEPEAEAPKSKRKRASKKE